VRACVRASCVALGSLGDHAPAQQYRAATAGSAGRAVDLTSSLANNCVAHESKYHGKYSVDQGQRSRPLRRRGVMSCRGRSV
jgi:hypothetical protein